MSDTSPILRLADAVACRAHRGQVDKAGAPYILHPRAVAAMVRGEDARAVALLHDVLEDTAMTEQALQALFGPRISGAVAAMTHREGESYMDYIRRLGQDPLARAVKLADLAHNMDLSRLSRVTDADLERQEKYRMARACLLSLEPEPLPGKNPNDP